MIPAWAGFTLRSMTAGFPRLLFAIDRRLVSGILEALVRAGTTITGNDTFSRDNSLAFLA